MVDRSAQRLDESAGCESRCRGEEPVAHVDARRRPRARTSGCVRRDEPGAAGAVPKDGWQLPSPRAAAASSSSAKNGFPPTARGSPRSRPRTGLVDVGEQRRELCRASSGSSSSTARPTPAASSQHPLQRIARADHVAAGRCRPAGCDGRGPSARGTRARSSVEASAQCRSSSTRTAARPRSGDRGPRASPRTAEARVRRRRAAGPTEPPRTSSGISSCSSWSCGRSSSRSGEPRNGRSASTNGRYGRSAPTRSMQRPLKPRAAGTSRFRELGDEAGLADPGLAGDEHGRPAPAAAARAPPRGVPARPYARRRSSTRRVHRADYPGSGPKKIRRSARCG